VAPSWRRLCANAGLSWPRPRERGVELAAELGETARDRGSELGEWAREHGTELAETARDRGSELAHQGQVKARRWR
jgi:hypothetical protein